MHTPWKHGQDFQVFQLTHIRMAIVASSSNCIAVKQDTFYQYPLGKIYVRIQLHTPQKHQQLQHMPFSPLPRTVFECWQIEKNGDDAFCKHGHLSLERRQMYFFAPDSAAAATAPTSVDLTSARVKCTGPKGKGALKESPRSKSPCPAACTAK